MVFETLIHAFVKVQHSTIKLLLSNKTFGMYTAIPESTLLMDEQYIHVLLTQIVPVSLRNRYYQFCVIVKKWDLCQQSQQSQQEKT